MSSGVTALALRHFTVQPVRVPLKGNVPDDLYFGDIVRFNNTWIALAGLNTTTHALFVADDDDMKVWRATYNAGNADGRHSFVFTKDYIIAPVYSGYGLSENPSNVLHYSRDGKSWYEVEFPAGYTYAYIRSWTDVTETYGMFTAWHNGQLGVLITKDFQNWSFVEDFPDIPAEHTLHPWNLVQGANNDFYIYSHFENVGRDPASDTYGITHFYKSTGLPTQTSDWEKNGEFDDLVNLQFLTGDGGSYNTAVITTMFWSFVYTSDGLFNEWNDQDWIVSNDSRFLYRTKDFEISFLHLPIQAIRFFKSEIFGGLEQGYRRSLALKSNGADWNNWIPMPASEYNNLESNPINLKRSNTLQTRYTSVDSSETFDTWRTVRLINGSVLENDVEISTNSGGTFFQPSIFWNDSLIYGPMPPTPTPKPAGPITPTPTPKPVGPITPTPPTNPVEPITPTPPSKPVGSIPDNKITDALEDDKPFIKLNEGDSTVISEEALKAIKGQDKALEIELTNGLVISIEPKNITDDAKSIDLKIDLTITEKATTVNNVLFPANAIVLAPAAHGEFGFTISFTLTAQMLAEAGLNGNNVRLYYVSTDGTVTEMDRIKRNSDGSVTISISHASQYVLSEVAPQGTGGGGNIPQTGGGGDKPQTGGGGDIPQTGDNRSIVLPITILTLGVVCIIVTELYRRKLKRVTFNKD